jgi:hypothetical protein
MVGDFGRRAAVVGAGSSTIENASSVAQVTDFEMTWTRTAETDYSGKLPIMALNTAG